MSEAGENTPHRSRKYSPGMEGEKKSSGNGGVEEEEEGGGTDTTVVMTCEGNITDPHLQSRLDRLMNHLQKLSNSNRSLEVLKVQPWNSVKVTFSIPKEAARRLYHLAQAGEPALRHLGILSVQVEGDQVVSLKLAGSNNETNEIVFKTDGSSSHSLGLTGSAIVDRLSGALTAGASSNPHVPLHHQMQSHPVQQTAGSSSNITIPYRAQNNFTGQSPQIVSHHGTPMVVRNGSSPATLIHHRPSFNTVSAAPPPYPADHPQLQQSYLLPSGSKEIVSGIQQQTYRLAVPAAAHPSGGRQVIVRQAAPPQMVVQAAGPGGGSVASASSPSLVNNVKNSPLLVGLLQQPENNKQQLSSTSSPVTVVNSSNPSEVIGVTSQVSNIATATHYSSSNVHRQQLVSPSNQYSSTTRSKDGLTTHQQVFSGGSVITNARVPIPGGLQQHPQATGKPPPIGPNQSQVKIVQQQQQLQQKSLSNTTNLARHPHSNSQQIIPQSSNSVSLAAQVGINMQSNVINNVSSNNLIASTSDISSSPAISPSSSTNPSLPTSHSMIQSSTTSMIPASYSSSSHLNALTPPLTPSNNTQNTSSTSSSIISSSHYNTNVSCNSSSSSDLIHSKHDTKEGNKPSVHNPEPVHTDLKSSGMSKENQYLINPNTGLLEPRPSTDSSDSESESPATSDTKGKTASVQNILSDFIKKDELANQAITGDQQKSDSNALRKTEFMAGGEGSSFESSVKPKEDLGAWEKVVKAAAGGGSGALRVKLKLPKEQKPFGYTSPMNNLMKMDRKDASGSLGIIPSSTALPVSSSHQQTSLEQRVPKLHIKFESNNAKVIVKPVGTDDSKDITSVNRKVFDKLKEDNNKKRKNTRKRTKNCDSDSEKFIDNLKLKSGFQSVSVLSEKKKARLNLDEDDRNKGHGRSLDDCKFSNKVDSLKLAKYEARLRTRPKMKNSYKLSTEMNNPGELTSHKILDTLPPSITRVAALHTQQPHRNPTPSTSSSSFFSEEGSRNKIEDLYSDIKDDLLLEDKPKSGLNGLKHRSLGQQNTFTELSAAGKLTIKRNNSLSVMKKEAAAAVSSSEDKRKMDMSGTPTYLNSSVYINKVSSGTVPNSSYSRLQEAVRNRPHPLQQQQQPSGAAASSAVSVSSGSTGGKVTPFCPSKYLALNSNSNITIQSVRKKDALPSSAARLSANVREDSSMRHNLPSSKGQLESSGGGAVKSGGKVTCIDVTDRKAVEEAVKSSRNSNNNVNISATPSVSSSSLLDSQQKCSSAASTGSKYDQLYSSSCKSSSSSTLTSSSVSSSLAVSAPVVVNSSVISESPSSRLNPESTNLTNCSSLLSKSSSGSSTISYSSATAPSSVVNVSKERAVGSGNMAAAPPTKPASSSNNDKSGGSGTAAADYVKSRVNSNLVDKSICDNSVILDGSSNVNSNSGANSLHLRQQKQPNASTAPNVSESIKNPVVETVAAPTEQSNGAPTLVGGLVSSSNKSSMDTVTESPDCTPKDEHGSGGGQGGEDSGIESMDALSEKSPNQNDQSPTHRRDENNCEATEALAAPVLIVQKSPSSLNANTKLYDSSQNSIKESPIDAKTENVNSSLLERHLTDPVKMENLSPSLSDEKGNSRPSSLKLQASNTVVKSEEEVNATALVSDLEMKPMSELPYSDKKPNHPEEEYRSASPKLKTVVQQNAVAAIKNSSTISPKKEIELSINDVNHEFGLSIKKTPPPANYTVVSPTASSAGSVSGGPAMIILPGPNGTTSGAPSVTTSPGVGAAKVVTLKSSFTAAANHATLTPVGKAFRLVSLPENMSVSPASSPVKGQLVTFKQLVPSISTTRATTTTHATTSVSSGPLTTRISGESSPSLLKSQLLAPSSSSSNILSNYTTASELPPAGITVMSATNGESDNNLDFVGFASSKVKMAQSISKLSQVITPEKDEDGKVADLLMSPPTEDDPTPLRVQPPLYTYGGNKDRKREFENEQEENKSGGAAANNSSSSIKLVNNTSESDIKDNNVLQISENNSNTIPQLINSTPVAANNNSGNGGFDVLTIEIPASTPSEGQSVTASDDKRHTRSTRQSARLASPLVTTNSTEAISAPPPPPPQTTPSNTPNLSMSSIALNAVSVSGRVLANSGSITVTSLNTGTKAAVGGGQPPGGASPATRGSNKRRRTDTLAPADGLEASSEPPTKVLRKKAPITRASNKDTPSSDQPLITTTLLNNDGCDLESSDGDESGDMSGGGVVVIGVASCLPHVNMSSPSKLKKTAVSSMTPSKVEEEDSELPLRPGSRGSSSRCLQPHSKQDFPSLTTSSSAPVTSCSSLPSRPNTPVRRSALLKLGMPLKGFSATEPTVVLVDALAPSSDTIETSIRETRATANKGAPPTSSSTLTNASSKTSSPATTNKNNNNINKDSSTVTDHHSHSTTTTSSGLLPSSNSEATALLASDSASSNTTTNRRKTRSTAAVTEDATSKRRRVSKDK